MKAHDLRRLLQMAPQARARVTVVEELVEDIQDVPTREERVQELMDALMDTLVGPDDDPNRPSVSWTQVPDNADFWEAKNILEEQGFTVETRTTQKNRVGDLFSKKPPEVTRYARLTAKDPHET